MTKRLVGIHLIEREGKVTILGNNLFETGEWANISTESANALIGGQIHLHFSQGALSYRSGTILGYRTIHDEKTGRPRRIFQFRGMDTWAGTNPASTTGNWGNEQKRIYLETDELAA